MVTGRFFSTAGEAFASCTIYGEVVHAMKSSGHSEALVKRFSDQRRMALAILFALLAYMRSQGGLTFAEIIIGCLLLSSNVSLIYDNISDGAFEVYVGALGPLAFTLINLLPLLMAKFVLIIEICAVTESKFVGGTILAAALMPVLLQVVSSMFVVQKRQQARDLLGAGLDSIWKVDV